MKKVVFVFGTRPEAIKLAPVYLKACLHQVKLSPEIWLSGQHQAMLTQAMATFGLQAERNFSVMSEGQTLNHLVAKIINCFEQAASETRPDLVVVQGDTTTTLAAALAAFNLRIPVAHVEAGLRSGNRFSPFPEEVNRKLTTSLADYHFAPTESAKKNLLKEGIPESRIWLTGNTVIDALDMVAKRLRQIPPQFPDDFPAPAFQGGKKVVLITGHRRESFGPGFESLCSAIKTLALDNLDVSFVYPLHLNPNVREPVKRILGEISNVYLIEPLDYESFVWAMDNSYLMISDSGGVQEEAPHLGVPVLVTREVTERPEAIAAGTCMLVGTDQEKIVDKTSLLLRDKEAYQRMSKASNPFGDGRAAERILEVLLR